MSKKVKELEEELKKKVDTDVFDNEIAALRAMIGNLEPDEKPSQIDVSSNIQANNANQLNSQETKKIKDLLERFP